MKCIAGILILREPRGQKELDMLIDTTGNVNGGVTDLSARGKRNDPFRGMGNLFHKFLRKAGFYLITRHPSIVQLELISGYTDSL